MIASFIIALRETLEAALIVGIVLSYLARTKQTKYNFVVYLGIIVGIIVSIIGAFLFVTVAGGFTGRAEEIFGGVATLVGALLLTTMILWMMKQKHIAMELEQKVATELGEAHKLGLFSLVFISVLREGIETVIFLGAVSFVSTDNTLLGAIAGILVAIILGYAIFEGSVKINLKKFFNITSVVLIFFAAGLVAYGMHELQEAGVIPTIIEHVWDINPPVNPDGSYPLLHENGYIGSILKGLFGYNGNPSLIEVLSYSVYLVLVFGLWRLERGDQLKRKEYIKASKAIQL
ncbi:MAG: FTR1 family protein [Promethearchaeota archaeon]